MVEYGEGDVALYVAAARRPTVAATPYAATSYTAADMCGGRARDTEFGRVWLYAARLEGLTPGALHWYALGRRDAVPFTPPPAPSPHATLTFAAYGDAGEPGHPKCPGAAAVADALASAVASRSLDLLLHVGDIAYADGDAGAWDRYAAAAEAAAGSVPLAVAVGNHEAADSRGECGVPLAARYGDVGGWRAALEAAAGDGTEKGIDAATLDTAAAPPFWYSFDAGPVAFTILSSEHAVHPGSPQHAWAAARLLSVDRRVTPWSILALHRPLYVPFPHKANREFGRVLRAALEPLLLAAGVDVVLAGHVHAYARSCPVAAKVCAPDGYGDDGPAPPRGPIHFTLGTGGRRLSGVSTNQPHWVDAALSEWGHLRVVAGPGSLRAEFVSAATGDAVDAVEIRRGAGAATAAA